MDDDLDAWRREHEQSLTREDGWLAQVELHTLDEPLTLDVGTFTPGDDGVRFVAATDVTLRGEPCREALLSPDDVVVAAGRRYQLVRRGNSLLVRVRDANAPARASFRGLVWYPVSRAWVIEGSLQAAPREENMQFTGGEHELALSPGAVTFAIEGVACELTPYVRPSGELLFVFRDATNGDTTYELCRYFYAPPPVEGRVVLDFNKAAAPICALVPSVTCVLPPRQNRLAVRVEAGEKRQP